MKVDGEPLSEKERASVALRAECRRVVAACKGNKSEAARQLGMSRNRLDRILGRSGSEIGRLGPDGRQAGS